MTFSDFSKKISDLFDETPAQNLTAETRFKELPDWTSIVALSLIAVVFDEYGVNFEDDDISSAETLNDLFNIIISRK